MEGLSCLCVILCIGSGPARGCMCYSLLVAGTRCTCHPRKCILECSFFELDVRMIKVNCASSQMPRHLISDAHEWINEIPTVPIYCLANPQAGERACTQQRGKKTLLSLTLV